MSNEVVLKKVEVPPLKTCPFCGCRMAVTLRQDDMVSLTHDADTVDLTCLIAKVMFTFDNMATLAMVWNRRSQP